MELDGIKMKVTAAVSDTLPVSVFLGTDVPELRGLIRDQHILRPLKRLLL